MFGGLFDFSNILVFSVAVIFFLSFLFIIVGVSNDAINFLSPAVGSKAASYKTIIIITSIGLLIGTVFSSGLMEVARKGIFHPQFFSLVEITILFLSVIVADILLLNKFNSLGLPTSTTVSIVFCLLGSAVAMGIIKIFNNNLPIADLYQYINTATVLAIILGIFLSVLVSFLLGAVIQYITRMFFTFDYKSKPKYWVAILGALAATSITHFMLIKGLKGAAISNYEVVTLWISSNFFLFILAAFISWFIIFEILLFFKANIFKIVVLIGTFSLAMAFAGNDLVNFIGVPLAALKSYSLFSESGMTDPNLFFMDSLNKSENANIFILLASGIIMVLTIIFSKKAKKVLDTGLDLSRQNGGKEKFGSSYMSKVIVRKFIRILKGIEKIVPNVIWNYVGNRFKKIKEEKGANTFDLVRASVILVSSSILISIATSYKLPLSTTYVTFMVAMGAAFADRSWGRESAVYRVNGVINVIGGWFLTALGAFIFSFIIANVIYYGGSVVAIAVITITMYVMIKPFFVKRKYTDEDKLIYKMTNFDVFSGGFLSIVKDNLLLGRTYLTDIISCLSKEDIKEMNKLNANVIDFKNNLYDFKKSILVKLGDFEDNKVKHLSTYVGILNSFKNYSKTLLGLSEITKQYIDNNHVFSELELESLKKLNLELGIIYDSLFKKIDDKDFGVEFLELEKTLLVFSDYIEEDIERVKKGDVDIQSSMFYLSVLGQIKYLLIEMRAIHKRCGRVKVK